MTESVFPNAALVGKAGAGKTTGAEILEGHYGYHRMSFAAPLKVMCGTTTDRDMLQHVGVGVRELCEDAWVNLFLNAYEDYCLDAVVVDDCRFLNEYWALKAEGFVFIEVVADLDQRVDRLKANGKTTTAEQMLHTSETSLDGLAFDYKILNTGDELDYMDELDAILHIEARKT